MEDPDAASPQPAMDDPDVSSLHAAMEFPITASLGPTGPLLRKLHSLMAPEHSLPDWLTADEIRLLRDGLKVLCISLNNLSEAEDASFTAKWWMKIVRELCYDTEDHLDEITCSVAGDAYQIAYEFSELIARVENASERRKRFQWSPKTIKPDCGEAGVSGLTPQLSIELPVPISVHVDTGGHSIVGVEEPMNKLVDLLAFNDDNQKQLKVVPIFGFAGVGKTTVARTLHHKYGGKFQCRAFVGVSRNPDMRRLLTSMLSQIKAPRPRGFPDVTDLIDGIKKHLQGKRYFIIMDDLWTASAWDIISRAFPHGDYCSRIITTTQIDDVAMACCSYYSEHIYEISPLNDDESRKLFFGRVFGSEDDCPTDIKEVSYEIIKKCGGLPLAIVNIASLLASEPNIVREKWKHVQDSLSSTSEGMKDVLNVIYNSLPPRLKTCLLYLSMYPEGYPIGKHDLVKQWIAEGFLSAVEGRDTEELAEGYFDELVSRGMVQAVDANYNGEVLSCTVHHIVLDLIRWKSMEDNFIIIADNFQSTLSLPDKVRRLSVQFGGAKGAKIPESIVISHVRSLIFSGFIKCVPPIVDYRLLQVLILDIWADQDEASLDLTRICELFRLRYLKIECNISVDLPDKIQGLQHLRTLQINARLSAVPSDIGHLEKLLHLCLPSQANLPAGIGHMTSLRSLGYFNLSNNSRDNNHMTSLGKLINLWDLRLTCSTVPSDRLIRNMEHLGSILGELSKLKSLILDAGASSLSISCDGLNSVSPAPALLERLELPRLCIFPSLPKWFRDLDKLCILKIAVSELSRENIDIIKGLHALTALSLYVWITPTGGIVFGEGFGALRYFKFTCTAPCLTFEKDAMPNVQRLKLRFNANGLEQYDPVHAGFEHLLRLKEISAKIGSVGADEYDSIAALWMNVFSKLPSSPIFQVASGSSLQIQILGSALEAPSSKHPSTPDNVNREFAESTIHDDKETSSTTKEEKQFTPEKQDVTSEERSDEERGIEEKGPREDMKRQADSRTSMPSGYIAHPQDSGEEKSTTTHEAKQQTLKKQDETVEDQHGSQEKRSGEIQENKLIAGLISIIFSAPSSQAPEAEPPQGPEEEELDDSVLLKPKERRKVLLLLTIFTTAITYITGLSSPGGYLDSAESKGDAFLKVHHEIRFRVLFYCNTAAFMVSLIAVLLLAKKLVGAWFVALCVLIPGALVSLLGAYAAGSSRTIAGSLSVVSVICAVLVYIGVVMKVISTVRRRRQPSSASAASADGGGGQAAAVGGAVVQLGSSSNRMDEASRKVKSLVLLTAILAATIAYQAGLDPPGGVWPDDRDGHSAGYPILLSTHPMRYKVFFYCNSSAFVVSLAAILMVQNEKLVKSHTTLLVSMMLDMFALMGAYAAGTWRDVRSSIYVAALAGGVVVVYVMIHVMFITVSTTDMDYRRLKKRHKRLLLVAILVATITYQAGLSPPGRFRREEDDGHAAGGAVLLENYPGLFRAFLYCNTASFMATIALILLFVSPNLYRLAIRCYALYSCIVLALLGLMAAYAAGSTRSVKSSIYIIVLLAAVVSFIAACTIRFRLFLLEKGEEEEDEDEGSSAVPAPATRPRPRHISRRRPRPRGAQEIKYREVYASCKYLMLFGILAASVTYQAGLTPPGGMWQNDGDHVKAGNPVLYDRDRRRYLVFFYGNSTSFVASVVVIALLLNHQSNELFPLATKAAVVLLPLATKAAVVLDLLGLLAAYAAGTTWELGNAIALAVLVLLCIAIHVVPWISSYKYSRRDQEA